MGRMEIPQTEGTQPNAADREDFNAAATRPTLVGGPAVNQAGTDPDPATRPDLDQTVATPLRPSQAGEAEYDRTSPHRVEPAPGAMGSAPEPASGTAPMQRTLDEQSPAGHEGHPTQSSPENLPPPPAGAAPKPARRSSSWRRWTLLGLLALILIAAASAMGGYRSGINVRQVAAATQVAAQLQSQFDLAVQEIAAGQYNRARQRLEYIIQQNPGFPGVTEKLSEVLLSVNTTATPTVAPTPTVTPTPDTRNVDEKFTAAQASLQNGDWSVAIETLLSLRKADPNYQPVWVDDMLYIALRNRGRDEILKSGNLEGGIYDLTLAEKFGPLDAETKGYQTWAELYLRGASFWELDWSQAVYYFAQVAPALPNLRDGSGMTATERYRLALVGYGDRFAKDEDWCGAAEQYAAALSLGTDPAVDEKYANALSACEGGTEGEDATNETSDQATPTGEVTPIPTEPVVTEAPTAEPVITEAPTAEPPVEQPTADPNVTPSP